MANYTDGSRVDSSGVPLDSRMTYLGADATPKQTLAAGAGGTQVTSQALTAPTGVVPTAATGGFSVAFGGLSPLAEKYMAEYYPTGTPTVRTNTLGTGTPIVVTGLSAGAHTLNVRAIAWENRDDQKFIQGPWSTGVNVTVL